MHVVDWFPTLLGAAEVALPTDRVIDGLDQLDWLTGKSPHSARDGYIYWMGQEMYGVKWQNFKLVLVAQKYLSDAPAKLATPHLINLTIDPQEREANSLPYLHSWTVTHFNRLIGDFAKSVSREPLIPAGASLDHIPYAKAASRV
jgi:arylsulfatase